MDGIFCLLLVLLLAEGICSFRSHHKLTRGGRAVAVTHAMSSEQTTVTSMGGGTHGQNFKYLPVIRGSMDDHFPRIIPIAGTFPGISIEQVLAPYSSPGAPPGQWTYEFTDPDGSQLGTVALPGSPLITDAIDPVVLVTKNTILNVQCKEEVEMLVVVDRGDTQFFSGEFFLFHDPRSQQLTIEWFDKRPAHLQIVGLIVQCALPMTETMWPVKTGFLEDDD